MAGRGWSGRVEDTPLRLSLAQTRHGAAAVVGGGALGQAVGWVPALGGGVPPKQGRGTPTSRFRPLNLRVSARAILLRSRYYGRRTLGAVGPVFVVSNTLQGATGCAVGRSRHSDFVVRGQARPEGVRRRSRAANNAVWQRDAPLRLESRLA